MILLNKLLYRALSLIYVVLFVWIQYFSFRCINSLIGTDLKFTWYVAKSCFYSYKKFQLTNLFSKIGSWFIVCSKSIRSRTLFKGCCRNWISFGMAPGISNFTSMLANLYSIQFREVLMRLKSIFKSWKFAENIKLYFNNNKLGLRRQEKGR